ncbi:5-formyltetrahydrofolate cyclo-ligase [Actinoplanes sp. NPDC026670]|uniref:5-formyltetrahydrofolate cyclo-ligase n=1 Tax=Actinoplanes sp. NPDC026670 TaxID=3154700 RepID=UPI0034086C4D
MTDLTPDAEKSHQIKIALRSRLLTARRSLPVTALNDAAAKLQDQTLALVRRTGARSIAAYVPIGSEPGGPDLPGRLLSALPPGGRLLLPVLLPDNDLTWAELTPPTPTPTAATQPPPSTAADSPTGPDSATGSAVAAPATGASITALGPATGSSAAPDSATGSSAVAPASATGSSAVAPGQATSATGSSSGPTAVAAGSSRLVAGPRGLLEPDGPRLGVAAVCSVDLLLVPALAVGPDGTRMGRGGGSYDRVLARLPEPGPLTVALLHDGEDVPFVPAEPHDRRVHAVITPTGGFARRP